jgi:hypothetical protein
MSTRINCFDRCARRVGFTCYKLIVLRLATILILLLGVAEASSHAAGGDVAQVLRGYGFTEAKLSLKPVNQLLVSAVIGAKPAVLHVSTGSAFSGLYRGKTTAEATTLSIGGCTLQGVRLRVFEGGDTADGKLGLDVMEESGAVIDCANQRLFLNARGQSKLASAALEKLLSSSGFTRVALQKRSFLLWVPTIMNEVDWDLCVDTASPLSRINVGTARAMNVPYRPTAWAVRTGVNRLNQIGSGELGTFRIGPHRFENSTFTVAEVFPDVLGAEHLMLNSAIIDVGGKKLYLRERRKP